MTSCVCIDVMGRDEGLIGVGAAADLAGTSVRTLQHYDRIGLLVAHRLAGGRRGYDRALLERLHRIRLMRELGLGLDRIAELLENSRETPPWEIYAEQTAMLEMAELRLRCRRAVAAGLAEVLRRHPTAEVPAEAMRALMRFEKTLLAYRELDPPDPIESYPSQLVAQVIEMYLQWKALSVQAMVLDRHGVDPGSDSGLLLGRGWQAYLDFAAGTGDASTIAERSQDVSDSWPEADRDLYNATKDYLTACHHHYLAGAAS